MKIQNLDSYRERLPQLRTKRAELHVENTQDKAQCAIIRQRMAEAPDPGNANERRVAEILGNQPVAVELPDAEQLLALQKKIEARNAAISILDAEIQKEERLASKAMLEAVRPDVNRLGSQFAKDYLASRDSHLAYVKLVDAIEEAGGNVSTLRITPAGLSDPRDRSGNYQYALREFAEAGSLNPSLAPKVI
jgi:hypothetical protein